MEFGKRRNSKNVSSRCYWKFSKKYMFFSGFLPTSTQILKLVNHKADSVLFYVIFKFGQNFWRIYETHFQQFSFYRNLLQIVKSDDPPSVRKDLFAKALLILNKIESINPLMGVVPENRGDLLIENTDIVVEDWEEKAIFEFNKALQLHPRLFRSRIALARLLEQRGELNEAVLLMNDGIRYYYDRYLNGTDKFYQYAIELNIMNGDTIKAKEIQIKKIYPW